MPPTPTDCEVYTRNLVHRGYGYPLARPGPWSNHPSKEYRSTGTRIGDVGFITYDGRFQFLFNATFPADHEFQCYGVPQKFVPLDLSPTGVSEESKMHGTMSYIASSHLVVRQASLDAGISSDIS